MSLNSNQLNFKNYEHMWFFFDKKKGPSFNRVLMRVLSGGKQDYTQERLRTASNKERSEEKAQKFIYFYN